MTGSFRICMRNKPTTEKQPRLNTGMFGVTTTASFLFVGFVEVKQMKIRQMGM
jgi:hypothetical protein